MTRQLGALSDVEFEQLVADLLHADTGQPYERFGVGPDGGIDLRHVDESAGKREVVQCKHYVRSTFGQLTAAASKEVPKLQKMDPTPTHYRFITSQSLTTGQKDRLMAALDGWITEPGQIWSAETIEDRLNAHEEVEQRHTKLWLASSAQLKKLLNAGTMNQSSELIERIQQTLPRYVHTGRFSDAQELLSGQGVCLIAGEPGIGKTTLAQMLLLDCAQQGFEPLLVSEDVAEAWDVLADRPQAFYNDDFLGRVGLAGLRKNEDQRLVDLMARATRNPKRTRVILTTREYILRGAVELDETFQRAELERDRFLLALDDYSRFEKGLILYNHLFHSQAMRPEWIRQLVEDRAYLAIVEHPNYNPRLVEFITGLARPQELAHVSDDWVGFALDSLNHPQAIWERAFEHELDDLQRVILLTLVSLGRRMRVDDLRTAVETHCDAEGITFNDAAYTRSLKTLEITFLGFELLRNEPSVDVVNPSVSDYVMRLISEDRRRLQGLLRGAVFFGQLEQLWEVANAPRGSGTGERMRDLLSTEERLLAEAFVRTFESPVLTALVISEDGEWEFGSYSDAIIRRLSLIVTACADAIASTDGLAQWLRDYLNKLQQGWEDGRAAGRESVELFEALQAGPSAHLAEGLGPAIKGALREGELDSASFDALDDLWRVDANLFNRGERDQIADEFADYATDTLHAFAPDSEEIERIEQVAEAYGVALNEEDLEEARENAEHREWEPDIDEDRRATVSDVSDISELDELFGRLSPAGDA